MQLINLGGIISAFHYRHVHSAYISIWIIPGDIEVFSERELTFTFAICCRPSVCLSVCLSSVIPKNVIPDVCLPDKCPHP